MCGIAGLALRPGASPPATVLEISQRDTRLFGGGAPGAVIAIRFDRS